MPIVISVTVRGSHPPIAESIDQSMGDKPAMDGHDQAETEAVQYHTCMYTLHGVHQNGLQSTHCLAKKLKWRSCPIDAISLGVRVRTSMAT